MCLNRIRPGAIILAAATCLERGAVCTRTRHSGAAKTAKSASTAFESTSKRRRGYPSESAVKRGTRVVHRHKELEEKLGKEDLCPCGSGRRFQALLSQQRQI